MKTPRRQRRTTATPSLAGEGRLPTLPLPTAFPFPTEDAAIAALTPHPDNYQDHPDDELEHIMASVREHGIYRPVVVARGDVILAGHGLVEACRRLGLTHVPVLRKDYDPYEPAALRILAGDNEIRHLALVNDRKLADMLRSLREQTSGDLDALVGTGYDAAMLANLAYVTRPASEIATFDVAAHWVGMPDYALEGGSRIQLIVNFVSEADRDAFAAKLDLEPEIVRRKSVWWPKKAFDDTRALYFTDEDDDADVVEDEDEGGVFVFGVEGGDDDGEVA